MIIHLEFKIASNGREPNTIFCGVRGRDKFPGTRTEIVAPLDHPDFCQDCLAVREKLRTTSVRLPLSQTGPVMVRT